MATIIPERPSTASAGERTLLGILARLPDDCVAYHEPLIDGRHPDFVVIIPRLGVLVIEVKGWYAGNIRALDSDAIQRLQDGHVVSEKSPLKQVRGYLFKLMDEARKHRWSKQLLNEDGEHLGRFRFPFAPLVVLPNITSSSLKRNGIDSEVWQRVFPPNSTITREHIEAIAALSGELLVEALRPYIQPFWSFAPLSLPEIKALRAIIHPEIRLEDRVDIKALESSPRAVNEQQDVLQVLDLRQEEHAQAIGEGHRIVYGVAGSGKTVLLLARAKRLAEMGHKRILVTCYNRPLAAWLRKELREFPNITVTNFHAWASSLGASFRVGQTDTQLGECLLGRLKMNLPGQPCWDAVLIDEAQDFEPSWFRCLLKMMADPENGDLLIVADGCQSLYQRTKINWSKLGIKARGRTVSANYQLDRNYRNAREIVAVAESFAHSSADREDINAIQAVRIDIDRCERTSGVSPVLLQCAKRKDELLEAYQLIRGLQQGQWRGRPVGAHQPGEIGILYPGADDAEKNRLNRFANWMSDQGTPATWVGNTCSERDRVNGNEVKIQTIHSAKGLQFRAVIIVWADKLPYARNSPEQKLTQRRLLYVGMTRAISLLGITASGRSEFVREIAETPAIEVERTSGGERLSILEVLPLAQ